MDARSVLSCLPVLDLMPATMALDRDELVLSLIRSWSGDRHGPHDTAELLSWITDVRTCTDIDVQDASVMAAHTTFAPRMVPRHRLHDHEN